jgi:hypothetical protein
MSVLVDPARFLAMVRSASLAPVPEMRHTTAMDQERIALLETATELLGGQRGLARILNVGERSVRAWLAGDRGISDGVLRDVAQALARHAAACGRLQNKIHHHLG